VVLWCVLIFGFSSDAGSSRRTSRFIGPVLRWLIPGISEEAVGRVQLVVRKSAHMTEYAVLAVLLWRARRQFRGNQGLWRWDEAGFGFGTAVLYAVTDEIHQSFVPTREGRVLDVVIDACGAVLGLLALRAWGKWRGRW
jgi:VanZ family protein